MPFDTDFDKETLYISDSELPEINSWSVGEEYELVVRVKMKSVTESEGSKKAFFVINSVESVHNMDNMNISQSREYIADKKRSMGK